MVGSTWAEVSRVVRALALAFVVVAWSAPAAFGGAAAPLRVVVTIAPLRGLVEPLLPAGGEVRVLMRPGRSEHGYEFTPADVGAIARADLVVYIGLNLESGFEAALARPAAGTRRVVCVGEAVGVEGVKGVDGSEGGAAAGKEGTEHAGQDHEGHGHEEKGHEGHGHDAHGHDGHDHDDPTAIDPHVWLDPVLVARLVPVLRGAVEGAIRERGGWDDAAAARLDAAERDLLARVVAVDKAWSERLEPMRGRAIVTHHNAFGRPAARYGFRVAAVIRGVEGAEPTPGAIAEVVDAVRREGVPVIFVEPQFDAGAARRIAAAAGVRVGRLDPLGDGDWFALMKANLDALVDGLAGVR